jgi:hypothetical protein
MTQVPLSANKNLLMILLSQEWPGNLSLEDMDRGFQFSRIILFEYPFSGFTIADYYKCYTFLEDYGMLEKVSL